VIYFAPSELDQLTYHQPGALPQASAFRAFSAWLGVIVHDNLVKIVIDAPDSLSNRRWMKQYKDRGRSKLEQTELWMVVMRLRLSSEGPLQCQRKSQESQA